MSATSQHSPVPFRRRRAIVCALLLVIVAGAAFGVRSYFVPPWRVRVHLTNIPVGTKYASLVADSGGDLRNMEWSPTSEFATPFTMHPAQCIWSYHNPDNPKVDWNAYVHWQTGQRYGVATRSTDGTWRVHWFESDAVPIRGRRWLLGGGEASFDITAGQVVGLSAEQVRALGLDKIVESS